MPLARSCYVVVIAVVLALASGFVDAGAARANDSDDPDTYALMAVQDRQHFGTHELAVNLGLLPLDAFTKGATVGGSYTLHFSPLFGWEIVNFLYSFPYDAKLKDELAAFDLDTTPFEVAERIATTNLLFKPVYWKGAWLNDSIIHGELFAVAGGGVGWFTRSTRPAVDVGIGARVYLSELLSVRLDIRQHWFFKDSVLDFDLDDELWIGLGLGLTL